MTASSASHPLFGNDLWSPTAAVNALKTTLGIILAWGLVLGLQWPEAFLAPIAVVFLQTPYLGASLRKGLMRVFGTLAGGILVLLLLAWLIQDRWGLLGALSLLIGLAVYKIRASRYGYAWFMVAITATIISVEAVPAPDMAFELAVYRTSEAIVGILIVLVINGILWPQTAGVVYHHRIATAVNNLATSLRTLAEALRSDQSNAIPPIPRSLFGAAVQLREILTAAALDSGGFRALRRTYEAEIRAVSALTGSLVAFAENLRLATLGEYPVLHGEQRAQLALTLESLADIVEQCQQDRPNGPAPQFANQRIDQLVANLALLCPTQARAGHAGRSQAVLHAAAGQCRALCEQVRQLSTAADAIALGRSLPIAALPIDIPAPLRARPATCLPHALVAVMAFWALILIEFHWQWPPGGLLCALMAVVIVGIDALNDLPAQQPGRRILFGAIAGSMLTIPLHLLVMPLLSGFFELALVLIPFYYAQLYFFHALAKPHNLYFTGMLLMGLLLIQLEPAQTYSLLASLNTAAAILSGFLAGLILLGIVLGQRPPVLFKRILQRLLSNIAESQRALAERGRPDFVPLMQVYEQRQREQLQRLAQVAPLAFEKRASHNDTARIEALLTAAQSLSIQARALQQARARFRGLSLATRHIGAKGGIWSRPQIGRRYQRIFQVLLRQLIARLDHPDVSIKLAALDRQRDWMLPELGRIHGARNESSEYLLEISGYYIGVARALREFTAALEAIDWDAWREPRF